MTYVLTFIVMDSENWPYLSYTLLFCSDRSSLSSMKRIWRHIIIVHIIIQSISLTSHDYSCHIVTVTVYTSLLTTVWTLSTFGVDMWYETTVKFWWTNEIKFREKIFSEWRLWDKFKYFQIHKKIISVILTLLISESPIRSRQKNHIWGVLLIMY